MVTSGRVSENGEGDAEVHDQRGTLPREDENLSLHLVLGVVSCSILFHLPISHIRFSITH